MNACNEHRLADTLPSHFGLEPDISLVGDISFKRSLTGMQNQVTLAMGKIIREMSAHYPTHQE